ncbi:MAG: caspase family protein [Acidobacteria bacterium]|nr:caspase family protein [Acidobacteriota bacterium]
MKKPYFIGVNVFAFTLLLAFVFTASRHVVQAQGERERGLNIKVGQTPEESKGGNAVQLWGVIIGVSNYKNGDQMTKVGEIPNLKNAADDAQAMYDFLRSPNGGNFKDVSEGGHLVLLKDENATKANVERELAKLKQAKPNDYFVLYIAAHGALVPQSNPQTKASEEVPYFVLYDSELSNMASTAIRMEMFRKVVSEIPAKKGLVLSDTCHSAGVQLQGRGLNTTIRANAKYLEEMNKIPAGVGFLSAADQTELSYELDSLNAGVFTYSLLEGLRGNADINNDGMVNFKELKDYVSDKVSELTERKQRPQANTTSVEANYIPISVVRYASATTTPSSTYGTIVVRTPDLDGVEVSIDGKPQDKLTNRTQSSIKVEAGNHTLSFVKGGMKRDIQTTVEAQKSKIVEVNLSFSEGEDDALVDPSNKQVNVFLREDKTPAKDAKDLFLKGVDSFNKQKYDAAIDLLTRAVHANGGAYADAFVYLGRAQQSLGKDRAAVESFRNALTLKPSDFETRTLLSEARFSSGDNVEEIVADLREVIKRHPNFEFARVVLADVFLFRGDLMMAEAQLKAAIRINPKSPPAHMILADVLTYQDSFEKQKEAPKEAQKALELFQEVSKKQVSVAKGLRHLSLSHIIFGGARYTNDKALAEANHITGKALTNLVEYAINNAQSLPESQTYLEQARTYLQEAAKLAQASGDKRRAVLVMATSAQNHLLREDVASAIRDGEAALKMADALPDLKDLCEAHLTLSNAYNSDQKYPKAVEHLQKYLQACGTQLTADARQKVQEDLDQLKRQKDANRKK